MCGSPFCNFDCIRCDLCGSDCCESVRLFRSLNLANIQSVKRGGDICAKRSWGPHDSVAQQLDLMINEQEETSLISLTSSLTEAFRYACLGVFRRELLQREATVAEFYVPACLVLNPSDYLKPGRLLNFTRASSQLIIKDHIPRVYLSGSKRLVTFMTEQGYDDLQTFYNDFLSRRTRKIESSQDM